MRQLSFYRDTLNFDRTTHIPFTRQYRIGCSSCESMVINGTPTHETGCPHAMTECKGCSSIIPKRQRYCEDCR